MRKTLAEMTHAELWELFPIVLSKHNPVWKDNYAREKVALQDAIGQDNIARMSHYGSTCVPNLLAKPTIDILLEIRANTNLEELLTSMVSCGYIHTKQPDNPAPHMMFVKGYTPKGFEGQVFHVHVRYRGDWDELYFRDYLLQHPDIAAEYGRLKLGLKREFQHDRDGYTRAKTEFIARITKRARSEMGCRYL